MARQATIVGIPPMEDFYIGGVPRLRDETLPADFQNEFSRDRGPRAARGAHAPSRVGFDALVETISARRPIRSARALTDAREARALPYKIMHGLWGMGQTRLRRGFGGQVMFTKYIIVVDADVNVHNTSEVLFHLTANTDPQRDSLFIPQSGTRPTCSTTRRAKSPAAASWALTRRRKFPVKDSKDRGHP